MLVVANNCPSVDTPFSRYTIHTMYYTSTTIHLPGPTMYVAVIMSMVSNAKTPTSNSVHTVQHSHNSRFIHGQNRLNRARPYAHHATQCTIIP